MMRSLLLWFGGMIFGTVLVAQQATLSGTVTSDTGQPLAAAILALDAGAYTMLTDQQGHFSLASLTATSYRVTVFVPGYQVYERTLVLDAGANVLPIQLVPVRQQLSTVVVQAAPENDGGMARLRAVENFGIHRGKKSEVVLLDDLTINLSTNNPRQVFGRVTGLNIWESDGAGLQLGIGGRGLNPDRTAHFNVRQNGYDISADALGYPESYYTPPTDAVERIEVIRGAASLQYGTQFGGLVNFRLRRGPTDRTFQLTSRQTVGSYGFRSSFNSVGGTVLDGQLNYYGYYQYKTGDGYRSNSGFDYHSSYAALTYTPGATLSFTAEVTKMHYLAQQPGGLTDRLFELDPRQSVRARNWFAVDWNLLAVQASWRLSDRTQLNNRTFGLLARRQALGNLERINVADLGGPRTLIDGRFQNVGSETRLLHRYQLGQHDHTLLLGVRLYRGTTTARQGDASADSTADFRFARPEALENSDYRFPNENVAVFAEQIFGLGQRWSLVPGVRFEHIGTLSDGYYRQRVFDAAGNVVAERLNQETEERRRSLLLVGLGLSYQPNERTEVYANVSQNYRAINFSDLRIVNPNITIDSNLRDERGFTADAGVRGRVGEWLQYEATAFWLYYADRIGQVLRADQPPLFLDYRYRGNLSATRSVGLETFIQLDVLDVLGSKSSASERDWEWSHFVNFSATDARYIRSQETSIRNKRVEMVPPLLLRTGTDLRWRHYTLAWQYAYTARHYSDATNAERTATAVEGVIPAYGVMDVSLGWRPARFSLLLSCNNTLNAQYFTRRAEAYPGPGIIPSDGRAFFLTLGIKW